ncbi:hypothetical protein AAF712_003555 [Marasmius tenuissimus]|uniref:Uncharacterized protein n=1 Tax=Marasmius tenuissimus TaxID=585030 RepID=A0ABR3A966_9AGAR
MAYIAIQAPMMLSKIHQILTTITSPYLRTVVFNLMGNISTSRTESNAVFPMFNLRDKWNRIDDLLSTEKFAMCVVELVTSSISEDDLITFGRKGFPKVDHMGRFSAIEAPFKVTDAPTMQRYQLDVKEEMEWVCNRQY